MTCLQYGPKFRRATGQQPNLPGPRPKFPLDLLFHHIFEGVSRIEMLLKVHSASALGIQAELIDIEVDLSVASKPSYHVVGLPDTAIKESGDRVRAAIRNCGYSFPSQGNITINLAPADFKKEGSCYDLPIALAILGLSGELQSEQVQRWIILGELFLEGVSGPFGAHCR